MSGKDPVSRGILKQMLEIQEQAYRSYRPSVKLFINDIKTEIKEPRKDLNKVIKSISFLSNYNDSIKINLKGG